MKVWLRGCLALVGVVLAGGSVVGDTVELTNGRVVDGEVVEDVEGKPLKFRYKLGDKWKTASVERDAIKRYTREAGDQSDGKRVGEGVDAGQAENKTFRLRNGLDLYNLIKSELPPKEEDSDEVVILSLRGPVEQPNIHRLGKIISSTDFFAMMAAAEERKPRAIVLAIDSPGGFVSVMDEIVERILESQTEPKGNRVVAWVKLGASAAAIIAMSCKEVVMMPQGRLGAATAVVGENAVPVPKTDLDQKIAALEDARRRQVHALTKRPIEIQQAMEIPSKKLYWHSKKGFSDQIQKGDGWVALDADFKKPLALEANELVQCGIAEGIAGDEEELLFLLDIDPATKCVVIDLDDEAIQLKSFPERAHALKSSTECLKAKAETDAKFRKLLDNIELALRVAIKIRDARSGYDPADLQALKAAINRCRVPLIKKETEDLMMWWMPNTLNHYKVSSQLAKERIANALRSTRLMNNTLPTGAIIDDLIKASEIIMRGLEAGEVSSSLPPPPDKLPRLGE